MIIKPNPKIFFLSFYLLLWGDENQAQVRYLFIISSITLRRLILSQVKYIALLFIHYLEAIEIAQISLPRILEILFYVGQLCADQAIPKIFILFFLLQSYLFCQFCIVGQEKSRIC